MCALLWPYFTWIYAMQRNEIHEWKFIGQRSRSLFFSIFATYEKANTKSFSKMANRSKMIHTITPQPHTHTLIQMKTGTHRTIRYYILFPVFCRCVFRTDGSQSSFHTTSNRFTYTHKKSVERMQRRYAICSRIEAKTGFMYCTLYSVHVQPPRFRCCRWSIVCVCRAWQRPA